MKYQLLDLFSGIGGFSLGLERSGNFKTVAFCEIEPFCRSVLKKHWPGVPIYEDVTQLSGDRLKADGITVDAICGGFPCQDISTAGKGAGLEGERSGLWFQFHRLIKETRPKVAIIENVSALRSRGLDQVLRSLSEIGYDAEWHCIPASAVGAPHRRDRVWIVAYSSELFSNGGDTNSEVGIASESKFGDGSCANIVADSNNKYGWTQSQYSCGQPEGAWDKSGWGSDVVADTDSKRLERWSETGITRSIRTGIQQQFERCTYGEGAIWSIEPDVGRVANGVPNRVDRLRALGNAVVPQIPEMIGRQIK